MQGKCLISDNISTIKTSHVLPRMHKQKTPTDPHMLILKLFLNDAVHAVDTFCMSPDSLFIREDRCGMCVYECVRVCRVHMRKELLELLSELITKTASNNGTEKLSMDSLRWLDSLSQLQNHLPPL